MELIANRVEFGDIKVFDIEEAPQLFPDFAE
jgi:hypothetical protein